MPVSDLGVPWRVQRDSQHGHDDGDKRIGELMPQLHAQTHGVETALAKVANVVVQLIEFIS